MIEERAIVTRIDAGQVYVQALNMGNCKRCAEGRGCGGGLLGRLGRHRRYAIPVSSRVADLHSGDPVVVGIGSDALLRASMMVYLMPLIGMIGFGVLARLWLNAGDLLVTAFAVAGLAGGLLFVRWKGMGVDVSHYQPVILRRDRFGADSCPRFNDEF